MPDFIANFTMEGADDCSTLTVIDSGNYADQPALIAPGGATRAVLLTDSNGVTTTYSFPIVSGTGDERVITLPATDVAYQVELVVTPTVVVSGSVYDKTQYFASSCNARKLKYDEDKRMFLNTQPKNILQIPPSILERGELVNRLYLSVDGSLAQGDVVQTQLALDALANLKNEIDALNSN